MQWRAADETEWHETPMKLVMPLGNDLWTTHIPLERLGRHEFTVIAWRDDFASLVDHMRKKIAAGQTVLIIGGSGAVGQAATDIARWKGAKVVVADRNRPALSVPYVSTAGNRFEEDVLRMTPPDGVDLVLDMVGGPLLGPALTTLREAGHYVLIASPGGAAATLDAAAFYRRACA